MGTLIIDALSGWTRLMPDAPAIVYDGSEVVTYREIDEWSDNAAHHLVSLDIKQGDRVGILGTNSLEWVVAGLGVLKLGGIVVPFNERFVADELTHLVSTTSATMVLHDEPRLAVAEQMSELSRVTLNPLGDFTALRPRTAGHKPFRMPEIDSASPAILIFTSGTSAAPKAAVYTHDGLMAMVLEHSIMNPVLKPGARWIYMLGMSGAPGFPWHVLQALNRGCTLYYENGFEPKKILRRLADEKIEMMAGVPLLFEAMMAEPEFAAADLSSLQFATIAGARCAPNVLQAWIKKGVALRQAYGMTEVTGLYTVNTAEESLTNPSSCGRGWVFSEHRVIRPDGTDCNPGEQGEIIIKSPLLVPEYWENEEATREAFRDGWFHTGDIGILDETGSLQIVDRLKDLIISGGYNIAPAEIENVIAAIPGVQEVCVIATPDDKFGETPTAVVHGSADLTPESIAEAIETKLARYKQPKEIIVSGDPLPRMASGKLARRKVRESFEKVVGA